MADGARIAQNITGFNDYINNTSDYLLEGTPTNGERLGVLDEEVAQWTAVSESWSPLYELYRDKENSRTTTVIYQLKNQISILDTLNKNAHILDRIAASPNVTVVDLETFNIKKGILEKKTRSILQTPIETLVQPLLKPIGGGIVTVKSHNTSNSKTAIITEANTVQYRYKVGDEAPASAEDLDLKSGLSTRASFKITLHPVNAGKCLYVYFRWYNTKYEDLAGPWCALQTTLIL